MATSRRMCAGSSGGYAARPSWQSPMKLAGKETASFSLLSNLHLNRPSLWSGAAGHLRRVPDLTFRFPWSVKSCVAQRRLSPWPPKYHMESVETGVCGATESRALGFACKVAVHQVGKLLQMHQQNGNSGIQAASTAHPAVRCTGAPVLRVCATIAPLKRKDDKKSCTPQTNAALPNTADYMSGMHAPIDRDR